MIATKPMVDTNILVYAHNQDSPFYPQAKTLIADLINANGFFISALVLHEFFSVITDKRKVENPLDSEEALSIINDLNYSKCIELLRADESSFFSWCQSIKIDIKKFEIYDAFIAYTMLNNNIGRLYTNNTKDFKKFDFIQAINPFSSEEPEESFPGHARTPEPPNTHTLMIPYGRQSISEQDVAAVCSVLRSDFLTQGPGVPEFEQAIAEYCGAKHGTAVNSGTSALHAACLALGLGPGDTLWTTPITFAASANCGLYCGADVDFVDIDPYTYNISVSALEAKLTSAKKNGKLPKIVVPVHMCGQSCDMQAIHALSLQYGFHIIEDASHAVGGRYQNEPVGCCRYSDITIFSFHPVKIITTGEGGMAVTNDPKLAERMELLRSHGITRDPKSEVGSRKSDIGLQTSDLGPRTPAYYYEQIALGHNYRMTDIQAALGISQIKRLDKFVARRRELAKRYDELLVDLPVKVPWQHPDGSSAWHLYVIRLNLEKASLDRRQVFEYLRKKGIGVNVHYIPVHTQPYYQRLGFAWGMFPEAEKYYQAALTLPLFPAMTEEEQDRVVDVLKRILPTKHTEGHG